MNRPRRVRPRRVPPRTTYALARPDLSGNEARYVLDAIRETGISSVGRHVAEFEAGFCRTLAVPHAVAVASGTAALHLALCALGVGPGDEVIVPDLTYVATANAVRYTGATVVLVDVDPVSWTIDPQQVEAAVTPRTKAIIAVHLYGNPSSLDALAALARARRLFLVEDAAQALGATWRGRAVGSLGDVGCFSLYGNKVITTGEGGMVVARSAAIDRRLRDLRGQAMSGRRRYFHHAVGFNYRMTALQAAVGLAQLERLPAFLRRRRQIAGWYAEALSGLEEWVVPVPFGPAEPMTWLFTVQLRAWRRAERDRCLAELQRVGVDARPVFVPMSQLPMYRQAAFPHTRRIAAQGISLPTHTGLRRADVRAISGRLLEISARIGPRSGRG
jgi:perosamine synthetase